MANTALPVARIRNSGAGRATGPSPGRTSHRRRRGRPRLRRAAGADEARTGG